MNKFTPFPEPQGCKELTVGEIYGPAMKITDPEDAQNYFNHIVHYMFFIDPTRTEEEHFQIQKSNLGYYAGYCDMETAARVQRLFHCVHPIFGNLNPTAACEICGRRKVLASIYSDSIVVNSQPMRTLIGWSWRACRECVGRVRDYIKWMKESA